MLQYITDRQLQDEANETIEEGLGAEQTDARESASESERCENRLNQRLAGDSGLHLPQNGPVAAALGRLDEKRRSRGIRPLGKGPKAGYGWPNSRGDSKYSDGHDAERAAAAHPDFEGYMKGLEEEGLGLSIGPAAPSAEAVAATLSEYRPAGDDGEEPGGAEGDDGIRADSVEIADRKIASRPAADEGVLYLHGPAGGNGSTGRDIADGQPEVLDQVLEAGVDAEPEDLPDEAGHARERDYDLLDRIREMDNAATLREIAAHNDAGVGATDSVARLATEGEAFYRSFDGATIVATAGATSADCEKAANRAAAERIGDSFEAAAAQCSRAAGAIMGRLRRLGAAEHLGGLHAALAMGAAPAQSVRATRHDRRALTAATAELARRGVIGVAERALPADEEEEGWITNLPMPWSNVTRPRAADLADVDSADYVGSYIRAAVDANGGIVQLSALRGICERACRELEGRERLPRRCVEPSGLAARILSRDGRLRRMRYPGETDFAVSPYYRPNRRQRARRGERFAALANAPSGALAAARERRGDANAAAADNRVASTDRAKSRGQDKGHLAPFVDRGGTWVSQAAQRRALYIERAKSLMPDASQGQRKRGVSLVELRLAADGPLPPFPANNREANEARLCDISGERADAGGAFMVAATAASVEEALAEAGSAMGYNGLLQAIWPERGAEISSLLEMGRHKLSPQLEAYRCVLDAGLEHAIREGAIAMDASLYSRVRLEQKQAHMADGAAEDEQTPDWDAIADAAPDPEHESGPDPYESEKLDHGGAADRRSLATGPQSPSKDPAQQRAARRRVGSLVRSAQAEQAEASRELSRKLAAEKERCWNRALAAHLSELSGADRLELVLQTSGERCFEEMAAASCDPAALRAAARELADSGRLAARRHRPSGCTFVNALADLDRNSLSQTLIEAMARHGIEAPAGTALAEKVEAAGARSEAA